MSQKEVSHLTNETNEPTDELQEVDTQGGDNEEKNDEVEKGPIWQTLPAAGLCLLLMWMITELNIFSSIPLLLVCGILGFAAVALIFVYTRESHLSAFIIGGLTVAATYGAWCHGTKIGNCIIIFILGAIFTLMAYNSDRDEELGIESPNIDEILAAGPPGDEDSQEGDPGGDPGEDPQARRDHELSPSRVGVELAREEMLELMPFEHPVLPHLLFFGPPGAGKTTFAEVIAHELQGTYDHLAALEVETARRISFVIATPSQLRYKHQLDDLICRVRWGDVILLDEIHGLEREMEESLYSLLQDFKYNLTNSDGEALTMDVPHCTFIGCTTLAGDVNRPLRERCVEVELEPSSITTLKDIVQGTLPKPEDFQSYRGQKKAKLLVLRHILALRAGMDLPEVTGITDDASELIARRALGIPRVAKALKKHARAWTISRGEEGFTGATNIEEQDVLGACEVLGIDAMGLHSIDRRVLEVLARREKPMGEAALAAAAMITKGDLLEMVEPRLLQHQLIERTPRGRQLTDVGKLMFSEGRE